MRGNGLARIATMAAMPPAGDKPHRHIFAPHALTVEDLEMPKDARASLVGFMVNANSIGKATLTGKQGRAK